MQFVDIHIKEGLISGNSTWSGNQFVFGTPVLKCLKSLPPTLMTCTTVYSPEG